jgi:hypothetical protein
MSRRRRAGRGSDFRSRGAPNAEAFVQREEALVQTADANPSAEHLRRQRDVSAVARPRLAVVSFEVPLHLTRLNPKATIVAGLHPGGGPVPLLGRTPPRKRCRLESCSYGFGEDAAGCLGRLMLGSASALMTSPPGTGVLVFVGMPQPFVGISGDPGRTRTSDLQLRRLLLYPLSYGAKPSAPTIRILLRCATSMARSSL